MDVLRRWKRAIWKQQTAQSGWNPFFSSFHVSIVKISRHWCRDWIIGMMRTFNEVALLRCSSLSYNCPEAEPFTRGALFLCESNRPAGLGHDSCSEIMCALVSSALQTHPSLPSTPFWCQTRTSASIVSPCKGFSNHQMKTTNVKMMEDLEEEHSHLHQHPSNDDK